MSTGTLVQVAGLAKEQSPNKTLDSVSREISSPEEQMRERLLESRFGPELFFRAGNAYFANAAYFGSMFHRYKSGTSVGEWDVVQRETPRAVFGVWDSPKLRKLVAEPMGTPIDLTMEEAEQIVRLAFGRRPDLPAGKDLVKEVRELLGHSLIERLRKTD